MNLNHGSMWFDVGSIGGSMWVRMVVRLVVRLVRIMVRFGSVRFNGSVRFGSTCGSVRFGSICKMVRFGEVLGTFFFFCLPVRAKWAEPKGLATGPR